MDKQLEQQLDQTEKTLDEIMTHSRKQSLRAFNASFMIGDSIVSEIAIIKFRSKCPLNNFMSDVNDLLDSLNRKIDEMNGLVSHRYDMTDGKPEVYPRIKPIDC